MKKAGIILFIVGLVISPLLIIDLGGEQVLPIPLSVTVMIVSIASAFLGPAFYVFSFPAESRKKIEKRALIISISLIVIGLIFAKLRWPGARIAAVIGVLLLSFFYGAVSLKNKFEKWKVYARSKYDALFLSLFDFLGVGFLFLGFLFKIQHWPLAAEMITIGITVLTIGVVAWNQKFKKEVVFRKETEDKLQESLNEIEVQHQRLEEKQKEITDSINYAKRIQYSLLANDALLSENLHQHFVLFKPKDIVSGDFYWATKKGNNFYLAICDCTGHGVPGAFMSLLNISFLNEAINEKNIVEPNKVLNHVRERLMQNMESAQDGMDATLICFGNNKVTYAAAHNKPVLIRNNQLMELSADKMPVGKGESMESFLLHTIDVQKNDMLYFFTDGYADQFGGSKGKKFKYKQLHEKLVAVSGQPVVGQKEIIENVFNEWKGNLEQIDDVCIVGVKI